MGDFIDTSFSTSVSSILTDEARVKDLDTDGGWKARGEKLCDRMMLNTKHKMMASVICCKAVMLVLTAD